MFFQNYNLTVNLRIVKYYYNIITPNVILLII